MTEFTRIPLAERIQSARDGRVCQPEYLPTLVRQWAGMPIKAYFGPHKKELERLYAILGLEPHENPSYQTVAGMISNITYALVDADAEAVELLAVPIQFQWEKAGNRRTANG